MNLFLIVQTHAFHYILKHSIFVLKHLKFTPTCFGLLWNHLQGVHDRTSLRYWIGIWSRLCLDQIGTHTHRHTHRHTHTHTDTHTDTHRHTHTDTHRHTHTHKQTHTHIIIIIIINIQGWAIWPVPSPELKLFSPSFLWSPSCSLSVWVVKVWF
jgi:hypothetical protein